MLAASLCLAEQHVIHLGLFGRDKYLQHHWKIRKIERQHEEPNIFHVTINFTLNRILKTTQYIIF